MDFQNIVLSIYQHIRTNLIASGIGSGGVSGTVLSAYPDEDFINRIISISDYVDDTSGVPLPVISIEGTRYNVSSIEIGSKDLRTSIPMIVDIFAETERQLDFLIDQIIHDIKDKEIIHYDYSSDFDHPKQVGKLYLEIPFSIARIHSANPTFAEKHRAELFFSINDK